MSTDADETVSARCWDCRREFYVTEEPRGCPYCVGRVRTEHSVVVRPH